MQTYKTFTEAYLATLRDIHENGTVIEGMDPVEKTNTHPDQDLFKNPLYYYNRATTRELLDFSFIITQPDPTEVLTTASPERNAVIAKYAEEETRLFDSGDLFGLTNLSAVWRRVANPDGSVNANYGHMVYHLKDAGNLEFAPDTPLKSQWEWAKSRLLLDRNTRQAYCHFNRPKDQWDGNLDQPCTIFIQYVLRNNKLSLHGYMRSNDAVYGTPYNISYFIKLLWRMRDELLEAYPGLEIGTYTHHALSIHYYLRNERFVKEMLGIENA